MHSAIIQISSFVGLFILIHGLWRNSALDHAMITAFGTALGVYVVLLMMEGSMRRILSKEPDEEQAKKPGGKTPPETAPAESGTQENDNAA